MIKRVGIIATGDELIQGQIQDTNAPYFANELIENGIQPGRRVTVADHQAEIVEAIHYLMKDHDAVITIGGLGPTSDDLTRFALADALELPLLFSEEAWQWLTDLLTQKGISIPDTNRQQALFPKGATPLHNEFGTAAGCVLEYRNKYFFMLPGPPNECRPLFHRFILPKLLEAGLAHEVHRDFWLLLGASESSIAALLEPLMKNSECELGYRVQYPYLEIKLRSLNKAALTQLSHQFDHLLAPWLVHKKRETASEQFISHVSHNQVALTIEDHVSQGALAARWITKTTYQKIHFVNEKSNDASCHVTLIGMAAYWNEPASSAKSFPLTIDIEVNGQHRRFIKEIPNRQERTMSFLVEQVSFILLKELFL